MRIKLGTLSDLPPGAWIERRVLAKRVAVYNDRGQLYGLETDCKHMKASLTSGQVKKGVVTCPWHGWRYDLTTGQCLTNDGFRLKIYRVEVADKDVYLIL
jgi:nitrite reductase/ring-hydroxylating ferredoxin subunit